MPSLFVEIDQEIFGRLGKMLRIKTLILTIILLIGCVQLRPGQARAVDSSGTGPAPSPIVVASVNDSITAIAST
ncbi:hypothetical protein [Arthrobacter psychrolactophilus]